MSDFFQTVVDLDATEEDAPALAARVIAHLEARGIVLPETLDPWGLSRHRPTGPSWHDAVDRRRGDENFLDLGWNGLVVGTKREVFGTGQDSHRARCPNCSAEHGADVWGDAAGAWFEHEAETALRCPTCATSTPLTAWHGEVAFAELGFTFWNWPKLSDAFVADLAQQLGGHRVTVLAGKA